MQFFIHAIHLGQINVKRVFVLSSQSLFSQGVEILLRRDNGIEFIGEETDVERAIPCIRDLQPDVVLLVYGAAECDPGSIITRILKETPSAKIVGLNLTDKTIRSYWGEQRIADDIGDLLQVIKT